jgi:bifunctional DNA-binding transcriptional regulator/antitoxin component of YhaV-PrlF toxin-antitoxin module
LANQVYVEFDTMPKKFREAFELKIGDPRKIIALEPIKRLLIRDEAARGFFGEYVLATGDPLPVKHQMKYARQCDWLSLISKCLEDKYYVKEQMGISIAELWENVSTLINNDKEEEHGLPRNVRALQRRYVVYKQQGMRGLVEEWRFGNDFRRKVTPKIEGLLLALYRIKHKPTMAEVHRFYMEFMNGARIDLIDMETGEVFKPEDFSTDGKANELDVTTIKYYLNTPKNKAAIDKERMSALEWNDTYAPHMMRKGPFFAFSKVTMDDTSSPFKMHNGDRPATYKMFDVASTALISMVMHDQKRPDAALIRSLIAGVIGLIATKGWKMPAEIEMERAITSTMAGDGVTKDVLTAGAVFPYTRWCKAKNPQEKRAEGFIKQIKYHYHKHREGFLMRPFTKRTENKDNEDITKLTFTFNEIRQFEMDDMQAYNNAPHPDQSKFPGMTRWQVLEQCQNPNLPVLDLSLVMPYVGFKTKTSIRRMRAEVQYGKYNLPDVAMIGELGDSEVVAYYIPEENGSIPSVYLYQDGKFICEAKKEERFQEAKVEQVPEDHHILGRQKTYGKSFENLVKERLLEIPTVGILKRESAIEGYKAPIAPMAIPEPETDMIPVPVPNGSRSASSMF